MKYDSLKDHVYNYISHKIQNGEYLPNQKITEIEICNEMGVSRTPAREALIQLASDNLLERVPRRGFVVKKFDKAQKLEIYEVIGVLDGLAGFKATYVLNDEDISHMEEQVDKIDIAIKYKNYTEYAKLQNGFHDIYINKCGSNTLIKMLNSQRFNFIPQTYISNDNERLFKMFRHCNEEHKQVVEFMKKKDATNVEKILREHWKTLDFDLI